MARELLTRQLTERGFEVKSTERGEEAVALALTWHPEVILSDMELPDISGLEVCRRLRMQTGTSDVPIVFLSASTDAERKVVEALDAGGSDYLTKPCAPEELAARLRSQIRVLRWHRRLRDAAMLDELTGVFSRRFLFQALRRVAKQLTRSQSGFVSIVVIDVDHFKKINDEQGHAEGDRRLQQVAETLRRVTRETDVVARLGGEEFVVVLPGTPGEGAAIVAEKIRAGVERECAPITVSCGYAAREAPHVEEVRTPSLADAFIKALVQEADEAMYEAKRSGRNRSIPAASIRPRPKS